MLKPSVLARQSTCRLPFRSDETSTAWAAPGNSELALGGVLSLKKDVVHVLVILSKCHRCGTFMGQTSLSKFLSDCHQDLPEGLINFKALRLHICKTSQKRSLVWANILIFLGHFRRWLLCWCSWRLERNRVESGGRSRRYYVKPGFKIGQSGTKW